MSRLSVVCVLVSIAAVGLPYEAFALDRPLHRGEETLFAISIVNPTNSDESVAFESLPIVSITPGMYVLQSLNPTVCEIQNGVLDTSVPVVLSAPTVRAHSTVSCSLKMHRSQMSDGPASLDFKPSANSSPAIYLSDSDWTFGPILDLSLHIEQIQPFPAIGERVGFVRVTVHNTGPWFVDEVNFGYCQTFGFAPFTLENSLPEGCAKASRGPWCFDVGGPSVEFGITQLSPDETKSCVLRVTANEPLVDPIRFGVSRVDDAYLQGDELLQDFDRSNDDATLQISPIGGAGAPVAVTLSSAAFAILMGFLLTLGAVVAERVRIVRIAQRLALKKN